MSSPGHSSEPGKSQELVLDGCSLSLEALVRAARDPRIQVQCAPEALARAERGWRQIESIAHGYCEALKALDGSPDGKSGGASSRPVQDYGITTGFGEFKSVPVSPSRLQELQRNILLSHSVGVGDTAHADDPGNYFPAEVVRGVLITRLNSFLQGHSGVRTVLVEAVARMINRGIVPLVPVRGSVGASGDLCPLAHLFAVLLGEGRYYRVEAPGDLFGWPREPRSAAENLEADLGMEPPAPSFKEGLALTNGTNFSTTGLALAVHDGLQLAGVADLACALSLEAVCGCARALDPQVHRIRGHRGQLDSAANLRDLLTGSRLLDKAGAVQDTYSLRCAPQVHGASRDTLAFARMIVEQELNAVTDNPLFFPDEEGGGHAEEPWDFHFRGNWPDHYDGSRRASYSAGNFHGQPIALAADYLAVGLAELANISERRGQVLLDAHHNRNLPANLIPRRGVNSGLMIAQYCAASLVSENKVLAHPASVDSIPTSSGTEDHVSMSSIAARKLRTVLGNVEATLAIELLIATQALEWRVAMGYLPVPDGTAGTSSARPGDWAAAEAEAERFRQCTGAEHHERTSEDLGRGTAAAYLEIRRWVHPVTEDRPLDGDVRRLRQLIGSGGLLAAVTKALGEPLRTAEALAVPVG
jgi:histidine ammonia-lyase